MIGHFNSGKQGTIIEKLCVRRYGTITVTVLMAAMSPRANFRGSIKEGFGTAVYLELTSALNYNYCERGLARSLSLVLLP